MEKAFLHKRERLAEYLANGYRTVLLLESCNLSLIDWVQPYKAFLAAERSIGTEHLTDVLYCWTEDPHRIYWFGFKGDDCFMDALNPYNLYLGPRHVAYWLDSQVSQATA